MDCEGEWHSLHDRHRILELAPRRFIQLRLLTLHTSGASHVPPSRARPRFHSYQPSTVSTDRLPPAALAEASALLDRFDHARRIDDIVSLKAAFQGLVYSKAGRPLFVQYVEAARLNLGRYLFMNP